MNEGAWQEAAATYQWMVPWRFVRRGENWFAGGYGNVAINALDRHLESGADKPAVMDARGSQAAAITFRDLYWRTAKLARWWSDQGMQPGDRIFIMGSASLEGLTAWLAAARLGGVVVRDTLDAPGPLKSRMTASEARWVVCTDANAARQVQKIFSGGDTSHGPELMTPADQSQILGEAHNLLDPAPQEANAIGALLYGDDERAYAYAGLGALMGWHQSLKRFIGLEAGDIVGIASHYGGLSDLLVLTLGVMASGATSLWIDSQSMSPSLTKLICHPLDLASLTTWGNSWQQILILGPHRDVPLPAFPGHKPVYAQGDMTDGLWIEPWTDPEPAPSEDRSRVMRAAWPRDNPSHDWIAPAVLTHEA